MDARARGPTFSSGPGQYRQLEARLAVVIKRSGGQPLGQRRWSQGSTDQQPPATANTPLPRRRGCYVCGHPG